MAAQVLAEVVTAAVRAVDGEDAPAPESGEMPAERDGPTDTAEATSSPYPEAETPCRVAPGKGSTDGEAAGEAAEAGVEVEAMAAESESTVTATAAAEATVEQTDAESKDAVPTE